MSTSPVAHSSKGASSSHRWLNCPGSLKKSAGLPNGDNDASREGTMLHDVAANWLIGYRDGDVFGKFAGAAPGLLDNLTTEQIEVVRAYVYTIQDDIGLYGYADEFLIEERISIPDLHKDFWGTNDCATVVGNKLTVYDLKCGFHPVEVEYDGMLNPQLGYYLLGVISRLGGYVGPDNVALPQSISALEIVVVQPRMGGVKRRQVDVVELYDLAQRLRVAATLADSDLPPVLAGDWCRWCPARRECRERRDYALSVARSEFGAEVPPASELSDEQLAELLPRLEHLEAWIKDLREAAKERLGRKQDIPGWSLTEPTKGRRQWSKDEEEVSLLLGAWGIPPDKIWVRKLISPAEAERLARVYCDERIDLRAIVARKEIPGDLTRNKPSSAKEDFSAVNE